MCFEQLYLMIGLTNKQWLGPLSSFTVITPPFILLKLLRETRDRWVAQVSFIIIYSTGLTPFPRPSARPTLHSAKNAYKTVFIAKYEPLLWISPLTCQSHFTSPLTCQSHSTSPLICQSHFTYPLICQSLFTSPLTLQSLFTSLLIIQSPLRPRSSQSPLQSPLRPRSSQSPLQSPLCPRSSQSPLQSPLRPRSLQSPLQSPCWFRPALLCLCWFRPALLCLRWFHPALLCLRWFRPAHLCLRWPHPAHLRLRWFLPVQRHPSAPETQHLQNAPWHSRLQSASLR